ncbi:MAG: hypothetical protein M1365_11385, partial [Actinobacteria bacterium]|nr:hypothetical protein [Actinomycetota bacterium]
LFIITILSIYPFEILKKIYSELKQSFASFKINKNKKTIFFIFLFILLAFLKLQTPEIREDQYHLDLAKEYYSKGSIMADSKQMFYVLPTPQLGEMFYIISFLFNTKESARFIHFTFYLLVLLCLYNFSKYKNYKFAIIAPLIFTSATEVLKETASPYVDFQWILPFLLATYILIREKKEKTDYLLSGILLGVMLAAKLWTIAFMPIPVFYILIKNKVGVKTLKSVLIFLVGAIIPSVFWYLRNYMLTGNPVYPAFNSEISLENESIALPLSNVLGINYSILSFSYINVFGPLFYLGLLLMVFNIKKVLYLFRRDNMFFFFGLFLIELLFIKYHFGRYLLGIFALSSLILANQFYLFMRNKKMFESLFYFALSGILIYYFLNTLILIPFQYEWADKNTYLTRMLSRDNSSYYDFDKLFDKHIEKNDLVATYRLFGFYYADFNHIDVNNIFSKNEKSFTALKKNGATKLVIHGGDIIWFCKTLSLKDCTKDRYFLISSYQNFRYMYLVR